MTKAAVKPVAEHWKSDPDDHDYDAAKDYLSLLLPPKTAQQHVDRLREAKLEHRKAKDILRASGLPLLGRTDSYVAKDLAKVKAGTPLSPVLLIRGRIPTRVPLTVADGYHRICASYHLDPNAEVPCRVVGLEVHG